MLNAVDFDIVFVTDTGITIDGDFARKQGNAGRKLFCFHLVFKFMNKFKNRSCEESFSIGSIPMAIL